MNGNCLNSMILKIFITIDLAVYVVEVLAVHSSRQMVRRRASATEYGSQLEDGLRSSR